MDRLSILLVLALLTTLAAVAVGDRVEVPCDEYKRATGRDLCRIAPALKLNRSDWEKQRGTRREPDQRPRVDLWNEGRTSVPCTDPSAGLARCNPPVTGVPRQELKPVIDNWE